MTDMLQPGARIGILGGGQLGRMLAMAAARLGFDAVIYTPDEDSPASRVAAETVLAPYEDLEAVRRFARSVDVVTYEFENVPVETAHAAAGEAPVRPDPKALEVAQALRATASPATRLSAYAASSYGANTEANAGEKTGGAEPPQAQKIKWAWPF